MQTLYRRLLSLLPRLGLHVTDLGPGTAVVSRRGGRVRTRLGSGADLLTKGGGRFTVTATGKDAWLITRAGADERTLQLAAAEYLCTQHVTAMLDLYGVNCVFDVGANAGQYARRLRRLGYTGRIVSFEPTADAYDRLRKAAENDTDWHVHHLGLGRDDTVTTIHTGWNTMNSLLPPSDYGRDRYQRFAKSRTEEIRIRRLDDVMEEALDGIPEPRPFLKMDTQGYDLEVFAGAGERIADFVGLQSEVAMLRLYEGSPRMSESLAAYEDSGFEVTGMYPVTREAGTGRVVEFDCVMMRAKAAPETD
jgi:FkbM family methyltransferase